VERRTFAERLVGMGETSLRGSPGGLALLGKAMSVVIYLRSDPYHVSVSQGAKVSPGTFLPADEADDERQPSVDVEDEQRNTVASFARAEVVGYHIQATRSF
jgi:hypothetical protein